MRKLSLLRWFLQSADSIEIYSRLMSVCSVLECSARLLDMAIKRMLLQKLLVHLEINLSSRVLYCHLNIHLYWNSSSTEILLLVFTFFWCSSSAGIPPLFSSNSIDALIGVSRIKLNIISEHLKLFAFWTTEFQCYWIPSLLDTCNQKIEYGPQHSYQ